MKLTTLAALTQGSPFLGLGIAGNQAEHLDQAGEANDFLEVDAPDNAPKGIFPWFIPQNPGFLGVNPLSHSQLTHNGEGRLQPEPEIALVLKLHYADSANSENLLESVSTLGFSVFNDCSRRENEPKISLKKNWGPASQGMAEHVALIDDFATPGGSIDRFRLTCHLERDGQLHTYGKDTAVSDYCYFNQELLDWITQQINSQQDHGPLEHLSSMIADSKPGIAVIGIGATCYSDFGNSEARFLQEGDRIHITAYDATQHNAQAIESMLQGDTQIPTDGTVINLQQAVARAAVAALN